jgi:hypothetical protein
MTTTVERSEGFYLGIRRALVYGFWVSVLAGVATAVVRVRAEETYKHDVGSYLSRSTFAPSRAAALEDLDRALAGLRARGATSGFTTIFGRDPAEDVGVWYERLQHARDGLASGSLEIRDYRLAVNSLGGVLSQPEGIAIAGYNRAHAAWWTLLLALEFLFGLLYMFYEDGLGERAYRARRRTFEK